MADVELRWLRKSGTSDKRDKLQYRSTFTEYFGGMPSDSWSDWEDVPVVIDFTNNTGESE